MRVVWIGYRDQMRKEIKLSRRNEGNEFKARAQIRIEEELEWTMPEA